MDGYVVSARKYRPKGFEEVVGQEHITTTLKNSIDNGHLAQALLFCGPRGVGKTTCARIVAKMINELDEEADPSHNIFELDAASNNSVDHIRSLTDQVRYPPQYGKYKVYIIDEVHMLSNQAFNAFLKTLEEPPSYAIFILATTEKHKVIPTILSRCQIYDFNRIEVNDIKGHLEEIAKREDIKYEEDALYLIGQKADGALRDALSIFDLIVNFSTDNSITYASTIDNLHILDYDYYFRLTDNLLKQDHSAALLIFDEILKKGFDGHNFIVGLAEHFRNLMVCKDKSTVDLLEIADSVKEKYYAQATTSDLSFILSALNLCNQCDINYKTSKNQRLTVELALMKIAHIPSILDTNSLTGDEEATKKKTSDEPELNSPSSGSTPETKQELISEQVPAPDPEPAKEPLPIEEYEQPKSEISSVKEPTQVDESSVDPPEKAPIKEPLKLKKSSKLKSTGKLPSLNGIKESAAQSNESTTSNKEDDSEENTEEPEIISDEQLVKEEVRKALNKIGENAKSSQERNLLNSEFEIIEGNTVFFTLTNPVMIDVLERYKTEMVGLLKRELNVKLVKVSGEVVEEENNGERKLYTNREKFEYLADKEPLVRDLSKKLGLDPDF